jgi:hypothetical protein
LGVLCINSWTPSPIIVILRFSLLGKCYLCFSSLFYDSFAHSTVGWNLSLLFCFQSFLTLTGLCTS